MCGFKYHLANKLTFLPVNGKYEYNIFLGKLQGFDLFFSPSGFAWCEKSRGVVLLEILKNNCYDGGGVI